MNFRLSPLQLERLSVDLHSAQQLQESPCRPPPTPSASPHLAVFSAPRKLPRLPSLVSLCLLDAGGRRQEGRRTQTGKDADEKRANGRAGDFPSFDRVGVAAHSASAKGSEQRFPHPLSMQEEEEMQRLAPLFSPHAARTVVFLPSVVPRFSSLPAALFSPRQALSAIFGCSARGERAEGRKRRTGAL